MCGPLDLDACHEHFSVFAFNETWRLLEQKTLSEEEEEKMLQLAMTSYFHFSQNTKVSSENLSVSAWLISRVFSTLGDAQQALRWAKRADFNLKKGTNSALYYKAYVHEAFGRAYSVLCGTTRSFAGTFFYKCSGACECGSHKECKCF